MNPSDEGAEIGGSVETEAQPAPEQTKPVTKSFQEQLTEAAKQIGIPVKDGGEEPVEAISLTPEPEPEEEPELEVEGDPTGDNDEVGHVDVEDEEITPPPEGADVEESKAAKGLRKDIAKLRERKNVLTAEKTAAEQKAAQLEAELAKARLPRPTVKDPFADVMSLAQLNKLEAEYRGLIIDSDRVPEDADEVPIGGDKTIPIQQFKAIVKDAQRNLDWFLPERKAYLEAREKAEVQATVPYPELKEDNPFTRETDNLIAKILNGEAAKMPDLRIWAARAIRGFQYEMSVAAQAKNGNGTSNGTNDATTQKIVKSAKQKIAPTAVKTRSVPDRRSASANLEKTKAAFEKSKDAETALAYLNARQAAEATSRSLAPLRG